MPKRKCTLCRLATVQKVTNGLAVKSNTAEVNGDHFFKATEKKYK